MDLPIENGGSFRSCLYVYQRVKIHISSIKASIAMLNCQRVDLWWSNFSNVVFTMVNPCKHNAINLAWLRMVENDDFGRIPKIKTQESLKIQKMLMIYNFFWIIEFNRSQRWTNIAMENGPIFSESLNPIPKKILGISNFCQVSRSNRSCRKSLPRCSSASSRSRPVALRGSSLETPQKCLGQVRWIVCM